MRTSFGVSLAAHAAILAYGIFALPHAAPLEVAATEAMPVELVDTAETTDLKKGSKDAKVAPKDVPQPVSEVKAPEPQPQPVEKPAETPVKAAAPPPPPPPEPRPEPKPEPAPPEPKAAEAAPTPPEPAPPPPEPEAKPVVTPPAEDVVATQAPAPKPRVRPAPPKAVAQPKPDTKQDEAKLAQLTAPKDRSFDSSKIQALLNQQKPSGGGDPTPSAQPQTVGSTEGKADAAMTQSWQAALVAKLGTCWIVPNGVREAQTLRVVVAFDLQPDGSLAGTPSIVEVNGVSNPLSQVAAQAAVRAVAQCAPYNDIFPADHYDIWQSIQVNFDPQKMFGAG